ncbi:hypothetical protein C8R46DRAFT_1025887 [Mycena filopes]|nr:hypothetical protein C8R46DRAFT_1025887 [Mycena filopes]
MTAFYTVLGGAKPAVVQTPPFLSQSHTSPRMPIVFKCTNQDEAMLVLKLQPVLEQLHHHKVDEAPDIFAKKLSVMDDKIVSTIPGPFYAVYRGKTQQAIFVGNYSDVETQVHDYMPAKFRRFETIKDAMVYMVLKGDIEKMQELGLYPSGKSKPRSAQASITRVYSHIRSLAGIIDSIYGTTSTAPEYTVHQIGRHASRYLQAHGYMEEAIDSIATVWAGSKSVEEFVDSLARLNGLFL